jgi:hypothetical protein
MLEPEKLPEIERVPTWANVVIKIMLGDTPGGWLEWDR